MMFRETTAALVALFLLTTLAWGQEGAPEGKMPPLTIPRLEAPPTLDGALAPGEWDGATRVSGMIAQFDRVADSRPVDFWIGYDDQNVYIAQRSTVAPREWKPGQRQIWGPWGLTNLDSSFVIGLAPQRINRGDEPSHYLLRVNLEGKVSTYEHFWKIGGVRVTFPSPPIDLKPTISQSFREDRTEWICEVAIPLAEMKVDAVEDGETWRVLFARDYAVADQTASVFSSDWKFWDTQGFWNMYRLEQEWSPARLAGAGAAPRTVNMAAGLAKGGPAAGVEDLAFAGQYDPILNRFYGTMSLASLSQLHLFDKAEVTIRRGGEKSSVAVLKFKSASALPEARLGFQSAGVNATILEWRAPVDGKVSVNMEGAHDLNWGSAVNGHPGETMQVFLVQDGKTRELTPRVEFTQYGVWVPLVVENVDVRQGDKIQFYQGEGLGRDQMLLRGLLTQTAYGVQRRYSPCEMTPTQGGASGVWFYRFNRARKPDPSGEYPLIPEYSPALGAGGWGSLPPQPDQPQLPGYSAIWKVISGDGAVAVDEALPPLTPGMYRAEAIALDKDRRVLGRAWQNFIRYDHEKDLPWLGNTLGISTKVQPPWTAIGSQKAEVRGQKAEGVAFSCWGRTYRVNGGGLFTGVDTSAQSGLDQAPRDILTAPVRLELTTDGKLVTLAPEAAPRDVQVADHQASWIGTLTGGGWRIETAVTLEYDGYALHRVHIVPPQPGARVDALRLVVPLKGEYATQLHAVGGGPGQWFRHTVNSLTLDPVKTGRLWHSGQNSGLGDKPSNEEYGVAQLAGNFRPYVWLGGATRGLAFMADNDKDWVPADKAEMKQRPSIEVVRGDDGVALVLNLVARPFAFDRARTVEFSLQATPIRPVTPDYQARLNRLDLRTAFTGVGDMVHTYRPWDWNGMRLQLPGMTWAYIGFMHGPHWYPIHWDAHISSRKWFVEGGGRAFTPYQMQGGVHITDVDDPRMPKGKQLSDVFGYLAPHVNRGNLDNALMAQEQIDYRLWCYDAWIGGTGISGMYFDITEPLMDANVLSGAGYVLDLPDRPALHGKVQPGFSFTRIRQFYKRLRQLFLDQGHEQTWIFAHSTDGNMVSAHAFVDFYLEGENNPPLTPAQPYFSKKYALGRMQALGNPAGKWGIPTRWLDQFALGDDREVQYKGFRSLLGYCRLHDISDNWGLGSWAPFDPAKPITFYPYWDPQVTPTLKCETPEILTSAHRQDNRLQVLVFNRFDKPRDGMAVRVDAATLGLKVAEGQTLTATDLKGFGGSGDPKPDLPMAWAAAPGETSGTLTVSLRAHDYRLVLLEVQDANNPK